MLARKARIESKRVRPVAGCVIAPYAPLNAPRSARVCRLASTTLSPAPTLKLRLLGGFAAEAGDTTIALPTRKARALLAYLALAPQRSQEREKLSGLFWG